MRGNLGDQGAEHLAEAGPLACLQCSPGLVQSCIEHHLTIFVLVAAPLFESGDGLGGDANLFPFTEPILSNAASCAFSFPAPPPKNGATKMMSLKHPNQLACWCVYCCCWSVLCLARLTGKEQESLEYEVPSSQ